ncbi:sulfatase-like hydrolase/transferase [Halobacteriaceae archaeon SHR40]|uniref:sulfatase-like hydrolase/transferase n=1 Tax=Halovenus amylolytica TaxID=2500550 RepID=UPI000FE2F7D5
MPPDIFLITADSLRADHCGWLGNSKLTPNLDDLAASSIQYSSAVAPGPRTPASVPVSHTGTHYGKSTQQITELNERIRRIKNHITQSETISEKLQAEGYTTVGITANPWTSTNTSFEKGFDEFYEVGREGGEIHSLFKGTPFSSPARIFDMWYNKDRWFTHWRTFYDRIQDVIDGIDGPVFLWTFLLDCHNPYLVPRADRVESSTLDMYSSVYRANDLLGRTDGLSRLRNSLPEKTLDRLQAAYRDTVRSTDAFIGELMSDIDDDSVVVFHADHGEAFGEHGTMGHQSVLYEENIRVPLLVAGTDTQTTVDEPVSLSEIPSMIYSIARGNSLDPMAATSPYTVSKTLDDSAIAIRGDQWKYIYRDDDELLFDLASDPGEHSDVSDEHPDLLSTYRDRVVEFYDSSGSSDPTVEVTENEQLKEHLRSLGYR